MCEDQHRRSSWGARQGAGFDHPHVTWHSQGEAVNIELHHKEQLKVVRIRIQILMFCYVVHLKCLYVVLTAWGTSRDGEGAKKHAENCESLSFKIVTVEVYKSLTASLSFFIHLPHVAAWKPRWDQRQAGGNEEQLQGAAEETGGESVRVFVIYLCKSSMKIKDHYLCISSQDVVRPSVCPTCICFVVASLIFFC